MNPPEPPDDRDEEFDTEWRRWVRIACDNATETELASIQRQAVDELYDPYVDDIALLVLRLDSLAEAIGKRWTKDKDPIKLVNAIDEGMKAHVCLWATEDCRSLRGAVRGSALYTVRKLMEEDDDD